MWWWGRLLAACAGNPPRGTWGVALLQRVNDLSSWVDPALARFAVGAAFVRAPVPHAAARAGTTLLSAGTSARRRAGTDQSIALAEFTQVNREGCVC